MSTEPLASKIRPQNLDEYIGQEHLVGVGKPLRVAIEKGHLFSFILWGPPGTGKTTLARIYADALNADFYELSAVSAGKDDIKRIVGNPRQSHFSIKPVILFLDEIHRFNKSQQDFLLPYMESGQLILVGATTENPSFEVIPALLSRSRVFILHELPPKDMRQIIHRVEQAQSIEITEEAKEYLIELGAGDARQVITVIEATLELYGVVSVETIKESLQSRILRYDKKGEDHYNTISAFIKSMRAGQGDAALYYLARMIESGEDPKFIARRMVIFASEDIGLAQPTALVVANAVFDAVVRVGLPEAGINLAHGVVYLSRAEKSRNAYNAYNMAKSAVKKLGNLPVPLHIRNAETKLMKDAGYGKDYIMYDDEDYRPEELKDQKWLE